MDKKLLGISLSIFLVLSGVIAYSIVQASTVQTALTPNIKTGYNVCVYKNGELIECKHNLVYNTGLDVIKSALTGGTASVFLNISLGNGSAPVAAATEAFANYTSCGLQSQQGTLGNLNTGNWSVYKTFTSTCDNVYVNVTRITNITGAPFAGLQFTGTTLQSSDTLTINVTEWATN